MSDKPHVDPNEDKQGPEADKKIETTAPVQSKKATLVVSIATSALLVSFALYTLLKTEFKTYPENTEVDIAAITKAPESLVLFEEEVVNAPTHFDETLLADEISIADEADQTVVDQSPVPPEQTPEVAQEPEQPSEQHQELQLLALAQQQALEDLSFRFAHLELTLAERTLQVAFLHEELDSSKRQLEAAAEPTRTYGFEDPDTTESLTQINENLRQQNGRLETQLAEAKNRMKQFQESQLIAEGRIRESEGKTRELESRNLELAKRQEALVKDKAFLESKLVQSQQKLAAQERSFQEVGDALKTHKEAMKRMDQARMALASELDATKSQYSKLLHAVATKAKEAPGYDQNREVDGLVATALQPIPAAKAGAPVSQDSDTRYHVVGKGDTLTSISRQYYGTTTRWHEIYEANHAVLTDHNRLKVGLVLVIP